MGVIDGNAVKLEGNAGGANGASVGAVKVVIGKPGTPADVGVPQGGGGTQVAGGGGDTQVAGSGGTQVAGGGTQEAGGGGQVRQLRRGQDPHINGFLEPQTLAQCLVEAKAKGWNAGVMAWEVS